MKTYARRVPAGDSTRPSAPTERLKSDPLREAAHTLLISMHNELASSNQIATRDSDLRAGEARLASLADEIKPVTFWPEAFLSIFFTTIFGVLTKLVPAPFGVFVSEVLNGLSPLDAITASEASNFSLAVVGFLFIFALGLVRRQPTWRAQADKQTVVAAQQKVVGLYNAHSALAGRVQHAGHQRVQTAAHFAAYSGITWSQIAAIDGVTKARAYLDLLAEIDTFRALDEAAYLRAGGDSWLELLRAGIRGEVPLALCLHVAASLDAAAHPGSDRGGNRAQVLLCRAERFVLAANALRKDRAYRNLEGRLQRLTGYSADSLFDLLEEWYRTTGGVGLRRAEHQQAFEVAFRD